MPRKSSKTPVYSIGTKEDEIRTMEELLLAILNALEKES